MTHLCKKSFNFPIVLFCTPGADKRKVLRNRETSVETHRGSKIRFGASTSKITIKYN